MARCFNIFTTSMISLPRPVPSEAAALLFPELPAEQAQVAIGKEPSREIARSPQETDVCLHHFRNALEVNHLSEELRNVLGYSALLQEQVYVKAERHDVTG
eukprot:CAMPEP_0175785290 /NCGR_PEP_ID=MMETSP0097-20121207/79251_1 /TAXON_ID=311494 /ORGANISM="Alexandrium monilatum, Strain CCMP3105" /LENGTH=100 /DNA_ID=CAMNT_0017096195 /DNA_START=209 /DNA_END=511 /DNA_ORIENTATION=+